MGRSGAGSGDLIIKCPRSFARRIVFTAIGVMRFASATQDANFGRSLFCAPNAPRENKRADFSERIAVTLVFVAPAFVPGSEVSKSRAQRDNHMMCCDFGMLFSRGPADLGRGRTPGRRGCRLAASEDCDGCAGGERRTR